jgi:hypothetical protein
MTAQRMAARRIFLSERFMVKTSEKLQLQCIEGSYP